MSAQAPDVLSAAFAAESRLAARLEVYAAQAGRDGLAADAALYRALAASHQVRARRYLMLMRGKLGSPAENRAAAFDQELPAMAALYQELGRLALARGERPAASALAQAGAVAADYSGLAQRAGDGAAVYAVCGVCGYLAEGGAPERCPVCGAIPDKFTLAA